MLSVIIPARNERFLPNTVDDILSKAKGDIEVIVVLNGYWPEPRLKEDSRLKVIHIPLKINGHDRGMRNGINQGVAIANGEYIMKIDAHCMVGEGFDEILKADCEDDWIVVPRRYELLPETWERGRKKPDYMYLTPPYNPPDKPLPKGKERHWEHGLRGRQWPAHERDPEVKEKLIDDLMTYQGSCYFLKRDYFYKLGGLNEEIWGQFGREAQELGMNCWLSGGRTVRNKKTWYAHLHKGKRYGRGYFISMDAYYKADDASREIWLHSNPPEWKYDLKWFVEKFKPPEWETFDWDRKCLA